ncbi:tetratricopeptide repeat protein [Fulvivirga sp. 29W222]|uniref:Tetratricopeptide repeat protein n=1 Tax=Fulvivirga marina TaxID=2494733 RepID=A0A937FYD1_9BACT|nr:tetratricopeptide repeat protein [Fulvivirga marina]MBL6448419.1 tetratricopeptide repeat protein [Fulvivirga marina]
MPRLITLAVFSMLLIAACTQEKIYDHDPAKLESLESTYQTYLNHYEEPVVAFGLLEKMKALAIELDNKEYLAKYYSNYAYLQGNENMYGESIKSYLLALSLYTELQDSFKVANSSANLGNIYRLAESPAKAVTYLDKAEKIYVLLNKNHKLPLIYDNLSLVYLGLEQFDKAEHYIYKSLEAGIDLESRYWVYNANASYGELYFRQQRFEEAIKSYEKALTYVDNEQQLEKAYLHGNIGECYMKAGELNKAEKWLNEALQLKIALNGADKRPNFNYLGELAVLKADYKAALNYYDQVIALSTTDSELLSKEVTKALDALQNLSTNTLASASGLMVPMRKYSIIKDKRIKLLEEQKKLIETRYIQEDVDKAELEIAQIKESEKYKKDIARRDGQMQFWYGVMATLLVVLIVVVIVYSNKLRKLTKYKIKHAKSAAIIRELNSLSESIEGNSV